MRGQRGEGGKKSEESVGVHPGEELWGVAIFMQRGCVDGVYGGYPKSQLFGRRSTAVEVKKVGVEDENDDDSDDQGERLGGEVAGEEGKVINSSSP